MTTYPPRREGDLILCGAPGCDDVLAVVDAGTVLFRDYYERGPDLSPGPLVLRFSSYAAAKIARGQRPVPRRHRGDMDGRAAEDIAHHLVVADDGSAWSVRAWPLPAIVPCVRRHLSLVDNQAQV